MLSHIASNKPDYFTLLFHCPGPVLIPAKIVQDFMIGASL